MIAAPPNMTQSAASPLTSVAPTTTTSTPASRNRGHQRVRRVRARRAPLRRAGLPAGTAGRPSAPGGTTGPSPSRGRRVIGTVQHLSGAATRRGTRMSGPVHCVGFGASRSRRRCNPADNSPHSVRGPRPRARPASGCPDRASCRSGGRFAPLGAARHADDQLCPERSHGIPGSTSTSGSFSDGNPGQPPTQ
jgi:hypothetical protein